jgi:hypothetical protein
VNLRQRQGFATGVKHVHFENASTADDDDVAGIGRGYFEGVGAGCRQTSGCKQPGVSANAVTLSHAEGARDALAHVKRKLREHVGRESAVPHLHRCDSKQNNTIDVRGCFLSVEVGGGDGVA